jgi:hypothetical protein
LFFCVSFFQIITLISAMLLPSQTHWRICIMNCTFLFSVPTSPPPHQCSSSQFRCGDGTCIHIDQRCNQNYDCPDKSDEKNCRKCIIPRFSEKSPIPPGCWVIICYYVCHYLCSFLLGFHFIIVFTLPYIYANVIKYYFYLFYSSRKSCPVFVTSASVMCFCVVQKFLSPFLHCLCITLISQAI